jgi:hypothetical protein
MRWTHKGLYLWMDSDACAGDSDASAVMELNLACGRMDQIVETDCTMVATLLSSSIGGRSSIGFIIRDARETGEGLPEWKIVHAKRVCNSTAYELAQLATRTKHSAF